MQIPFLKAGKAISVTLDLTDVTDGWGPMSRSLRETSDTQLRYKMPKTVNAVLLSPKKR